MFGSSEILIVAIVVLVLFGATALPKFFRSLGKAKSEFQKGASEGQNESSGTEQSRTSGSSPEESQPASSGSEDQTQKSRSE